MFRIVANGFLVNNHFDTDECTEDCGFELQLTIELCKLNKTIDEVSFRDCLENHFAPDYVNKPINPSKKWKNVQKTSLSTWLIHTALGSIHNVPII